MPISVAKLSRRSRGIKPSTLDMDINSIIDYINAEEYITFTVVTAGVEVEIPHKLEHIPRYYFMVGDEVTTGSSVNIYNGTTPWTKSAIYLTSTVAGDFAIILRR